MNEKYELNEPTDLIERTIIIKLESKKDFVLPSIEDPFACLIIAFESLDTKQEQNIAETLVRSKCRYVLCAGKNPDKWENLVDNIFVNFHNQNPPQDYSFQTTSHKNEKIKEVIEFFYLTTAFGKDHLHFNDYVILLIGNNPRKEKYILPIIKNYSNNLRYLNEK